jgi:hypothetical protein
MMIAIETIVNISAAALTASLIILNYVILKGSFRQNNRSIELYEHNLKISEESLNLNKSLLEENKKMIERQELDNRPKFRMITDGFRFDSVTGKPYLYLENIGGKGAHVRNVHFVVTKNLISVVKDVEIGKNVKPAAPLTVEMDMPVTVITYEVKRKDGAPLNANEIIFLSMDAVIEYTHIGDAELDVDCFKDIVVSKVGKDYFNSGEYTHSQKASTSVAGETWYCVLGTGANLCNCPELFPDKNGTPEPQEG